jgi:hypothetical protein
LLATLQVSGQEPGKSGYAPIFQVNVVESTIAAINYQYRQGPTKIDFRGTLLMPEATGEATVESRRGRTEIDANFEHVAAPQRFGAEYLTYTLWAVTPEGGVRNLAEIVPGSSDKASLHVSTELQAFGLIITAEPYSATRHPSNVVVLDNRVRPDTEGTIEQCGGTHRESASGHIDIGRADRRSAIVGSSVQTGADSLTQKRAPIGALAEKLPVATVNERLCFYTRATRIRFGNQPGEAGEIGCRQRF